MSPIAPKRPAADHAAELPGFSLPVRPEAGQGSAAAVQKPEEQNEEQICPDGLPPFDVENSVSAESEPDYSSAEWEYKPVVKYTAAGLLTAAAVGLVCSVYWLGHRQGFADGVNSDLVAERLNAAAVSNLSHFLQLTMADDAELQRLAVSPEQELAWVKDPAVRREAEWQLVTVLMNRGMLASAEPLLNELFAAENTSDTWAFRAEEVGDAFFSARNPQEAAAWYRRAAKDFAAGQRPAESVNALHRYFAALCAAPGGCTPKQAAALEKELPQGELTRSLRTAITLQEALYLHHRGQAEEAGAAYGRVLAELLPNGTPASNLSASEQIIAGIALAETGKYDQALPLLTAGENALGHDGAEALNRLEALRRMASVTMQQTGDVNEALALLNRAEGVAECLLPADHEFWGCLAEQRGWLLLLSQDEDAALASFRRAVESPHDVAVAMQAMEGAGRCLLALNKAEEAEKMLHRCAGLRSKQAAGDAAGLGRVTLLLAQAQDHQGRTKEAAENYGAAAALLAKAGEPESANYLTALLGRGYALEQLKQWAEGMQVWEQIQPLVKDVPDRREEAHAHLNECRRHNHLPSAAVPNDPQSTAEAAAADAAAEAEDDDPEEAAAQ